MIKSWGASLTVAKKLERIDLNEGHCISSKLTVVQKLGEGWEGEVYLVRENQTGIERVAKIFYPHRNQKNRASIFYAKKLHKLRNCSVLIQYLMHDVFRYKGWALTYLVSEYIEGVPLQVFLESQKGKKLHYFQALHLLHSLAKGLEEIHLLREYHGDLHTENIIVQSYGLGFDLKLLDMYQWGKGSSENIQHDVCCLIRIFYDSLGGQKNYSKQPKVIRDICCGLKTSLICKKYRTAGQLRIYLEKMDWSVG